MTEDEQRPDNNIQQTNRSTMKFGRFHVLTCIAGFLYMLFLGHISLSGMFSNVRPYNCSAEQQDSLNMSADPVIEAIDEPWSEHQGFHSSLSIQYKLCNHETGSLTTVAFFVGTIGGSLIVGPTSDSIGRIPCFLVGQLMAALATLASSYAPSFWLHLCSRCLTGLFMMFPHCSIQVYGCEVHSPEHRSRFLASWSTGASLGVVTAALLAHVTRDPHLYVLITCCVVILPLLVGAFLPESPAWLAAKGHQKRAEAALRRIEFINGRPKSHGATAQQTLALLATMTTISSKANVNDDVNTSHRGTSGWREWNCGLFRLLCILGIYGIGIGINCYGYYFVLGNIIPDVCLYAALIGVTQLPYAFVLNLIPSRPGLIVCGFIAGVLVLVFGAVAHFLPDQSYILAGLGVVGCFCSTAAFYLLATVSAELFPTAIRNTGLGLCTFCVRCGCALSPLMNFLPGIVLQSILLACPLLLSSVPLGLVLASVVDVQTRMIKNDELEKQEEIELKM